MSGLVWLYLMRHVVTRFFPLYFFASSGRTKVNTSSGFQDEDYVVTTGRKPRLSEHDRYLKQFEYKEALNAALKSGEPKVRSCPSIAQGITVLAYAVLHYLSVFRFLMFIVISVLPLLKLSFFVGGNFSNGGTGGSEQSCLSNFKSGFFGPCVATLVFSKVRSLFSYPDVRSFELNLSGLEFMCFLAVHIVVLVSLLESAFLALSAFFLRLRH